LSKKKIVQNVNASFPQTRQAPGNSLQVLNTTPPYQQ